MARAKTGKNKANAGASWDRESLRQLVNLVLNENNSHIGSTYFLDDLSAWVAANMGRSSSAISTMLNKIFANYDEHDSRTPIVSRVAKDEGELIHNRVCGIIDKWFIRECWTVRARREVDRAVADGNDVVWSMDLFINDMKHLTEASEKSIRDTIDRALRRGTIEYPMKPEEAPRLF